MNYERQILQILIEVGDRGISAQLLAKHVYNMNVSFFATPDLNEIKNYVRNFVIRNSKSSKSLLEKTGRWGFYRLNTKNAIARRTIQEAKKPQETASDESDSGRSQPDLSLDLFS